jgi:hypothetical protein
MLHFSIQAVTLIAMFLPNFQFRQLTLEAILASYALPSKLGVKCNRDGEK